MWHGFIEDIENTLVYFSLAPHGSADIRHKIMKKLDSQKFVISANEIPQEMYIVARILTLKEEQLENPAIEALLLRGKNVSEEVEIQAIKKLMFLCQSSISQTNTTENFQEMLDSPWISLRMKNIIKWHLHEKEIIASTLGKLQMQYTELVNKQKNVKNQKKKT